MKIRCVVACRDASGSPDFYPCTVRVSQNQYEEGVHYDKAKELADGDGYESTDFAPVFDEYDGPDWLFRHVFADEMATGLVKAAERRGWTTDKLAAAIGITPDRLSNGGIAEVVKLAIVDGDDPDWLKKVINHKLEI